METKKLNVLFLCTSNKDRSIALEKYFGENYDTCSYKSAGVNEYFTRSKGTQYINEDLIKWADLIVFAEEIHLSVICRIYNPVYTPSAQIEWLHGTLEFPNKEIGIKKYIVLNCGHYSADTMDDYITKAESKVCFAIQSLNR